MCFRKHIESRNKDEYIIALEKIDKANISSLRRKTRILIVDDEDDELYKVLAERQYSIYYKSDMTYALEAEPFDIVLLDIKGVAKRRKSNSEGFALACEIKEVYPLKKVCCYSATIDPKITEQLSEKKIDLFFQKDGEIDKMCEKLDKLIEEYCDYKLQWEVLRQELIKCKVSDEKIEKIKKAYFKGFEDENAIEIRNTVFEIMKNGSAVLGLANSFLSLLKVVMV